jgi:taurine dioxygenase
MLYQHVETPEFCMRLKWQANSIAFWDNRCVQHHALWDYYPKAARSSLAAIKI